MKNGRIETISLCDHPKVSVVIPHFYTAREENLQGLLDNLRRQSFKDLEVIVAHGIAPQGRAINEGARQAKGKVLVVLDDDSQIGHERVIENLVKVLGEDSSVAMVGASIVAPEGANGFQKIAARQFPRFQMPIVKQVTESDLPCHGCVAFRKEVFVQVGMEREDILRGLDPDLRVRIRKAGYRVVLAPDTWAYHPMPGSLWKFIQVFFRNGFGSAYLQVVHPELSYDTDESLTGETFVPKHSFLYRILRFPVRLVRALITFQWIRFLGYLVYSAGYLVGFTRFLLFNRKPLP